MTLLVMTSLEGQEQQERIRWRWGERENVSGFNKLECCTVTDAGHLCPRWIVSLPSVCVRQLCSSTHHLIFSFPFVLYLVLTFTRFLDSVSVRSCNLEGQWQEFQSSSFFFFPLTLQPVVSPVNSVRLKEKESHLWVTLSFLSSAHYLLLTVHDYSWCLEGFGQVYFNVMM